MRLSYFARPAVSVLFNEPKLLKCVRVGVRVSVGVRFSALQRAEIAEIMDWLEDFWSKIVFQCSSTSRNC